MIILQYNIKLISNRLSRNIFLSMYSTSQMKNPNYKDDKCTSTLFKH